MISKKLLVYIVTLGNLGYIKYIPGTLGSIIGLLLYIFFLSQLNIYLKIIFQLCLIFLSILIFKKIGYFFKQKDPSEIILDEFCAIPICFLGINLTYDNQWLILLNGFILYRIFDIIKPFGIYHIQKYHNGYGIILDDILASIYTNFCLQFLIYLKFL